MRTVDDLRAALADTDTPAGVDLAAVRGRAQRHRRRTAGTLLAAAATVAAVVAIPSAAFDNRGPAPTTPAAPPLPASADDCPNRLPQPLDNSGPGLADRLVPFPVEAALVCEYRWYDPPPDGDYMVLMASRAMPVRTARALIDRLEASGHKDSGRPRSPAPCTADLGIPWYIRLAGAGRIVTLEVNPSGCATVTNGSRTASAVILKGLPFDAWTGAPPRLTCPDRPVDSQVPVAGPPHRLVPYRPDRLLVCRYPVQGPAKVADSVREIDGPDAANLIRQVDALPTATHPCPLRPGPRSTYVLEVAGAGQRTTLIGGETGCSFVSNGPRTVFGVDWAALLAV